MSSCAVKYPSRMRLIGAYALLAASCFACSIEAEEKVFLIDEMRSVPGTLTIKNGIDAADIEFSLIDSNGYRSAPDSIDFNPDARSFSLVLKDEHLYEASVGTLVERMLSMGNALPSLGELKLSSFERIEKYVKLEIRSSKFTNEKTQKIPYLQVAIPLSKKSLYSTNNVLRFESDLELGEAVFAEILVVDASGAPLKNVDAAAVSYNKVEAGTTPYWHQENFRPVFVKTDSQGRAYIGPVVPNELQAFHVLLKGEGYCTYMSAPNFRFSADYEVPKLVMKRCDKELKQQYSLIPTFPSGLKYVDLKSDSLEDPVVHTNDATISIRLDSPVEDLRGFKLELFEIDSDYRPFAVPVFTREFPFFQSDVDVDLPKIFSTSENESGRFVIKVTEMSGSLRGFVSSEQKATETLILGDKRTAIPSRDELMAVRKNDDSFFVWKGELSSEPMYIDYWRNVAVKSETGVENIVSGLAGSKFTISSNLCREGYELGFDVTALGISKRFAPCIDGVATFSAESAGFLEAGSELERLGGRQVWRLYLRDIYGNEIESLTSTIDPDKRLNILTVIIDTGVPTLGVGFHSLGNLEFLEGETDVSVISKAKVMSGEVIFVFQESLGPEKICLQALSDSKQDEANGKKGTTAAIRNGGADVQYFLFRDELGRIVGMDSYYEIAGLQFVKYSIAATSTADNLFDLSRFTPCRTLSEGGDITNVFAVGTVLSEDHIFFPADAGLPAEFYLRVQDVAGNLSKVTKFELPPCGIDSSGDPIAPEYGSKCWVP